MAESSAPWNGTTTGDAVLASYDAPTEWAAYWRSVSGAGGIPTNLGGVCRGELNQLNVTAPGAVSPAVVNTGRALAHGTWYENSAAVNVAIATPAVSTRIDRIVLRKSWAAQTVRITLIAGVEGGGAPALTQVAGTTWDTPLAQVSITTGAVLTISDDRQFIPHWPVTIVKAADETVNNSAVLQNDDDFAVAVAPGDILLIRQHLIIAGVAATGLKATWVLPAGATFNMDVRRYTQVPQIGIANVSATADIAPGGIAWLRIDVDTVIRVGATGGTAQFQWAQQAAVVADTQILANSTMVVTGADA